MHEMSTPPPPLMAVSIETNIPMGKAGKGALGEPAQAACLAVPCLGCVIVIDAHQHFRVFVSTIYDPQYIVIFVSEELLYLAHQVTSSNKLNVQADGQSHTAYIGIRLNTKIKDSPPLRAPSGVGDLVQGDVSESTREERAELCSRDKNERRMPQWRARRRACLAASDRVSSTAV